MPKQARAYKFTRSLQWALLIGALAGLAVTGLTYTKFVWDLEPREPILLGAGTAFGLTLFLLALARRQKELSGDDLVEDDLEDRRVGARDHVAEDAPTDEFDETIDEAETAAGPATDGEARS